jgi:hypothetical protein
MSQRIYKHGQGSDQAHQRDSALFAQLLNAHQQLKRKTKSLPNGIVATTTSDNPALVDVLQQHVIGMEQRFAAGRAIRSWDPLFAALFEFRQQINMTYRIIEQGVEAEITADDPKLIELIHYHDATLHQFVDFGYEKSGEISPHPTWLKDTP